MTEEGTASAVLPSLPSMGRVASASEPGGVGRCSTPSGPAARGHLPHPGGGGAPNAIPLPSGGGVAERRRGRLAFLLAAPVLFLTAPAFAGDGSSARSFVTRLYAHYPRADSQSDFDPLAAPVENRFFDPDLVRLLDEDRRLAQGEVGSLDGDPLCNCQDDGGMRFEVRSVRATGPNAATATVIRHAAPGDTPEVEPITLDLVRLASGWRIRDIHGVDMASLKAMLQTGIREMKAR